MKSNFCNYSKEKTIAAWLKELRHRNYLKTFLIMNCCFIILKYKPRMHGSINQFSVNLWLKSDIKELYKLNLNSFLVIDEIVN